MIVSEAVHKQLKAKGGKESGTAQSLLEIHYC